MPPVISHVAPTPMAAPPVRVTVSTAFPSVSSLLMVVGLNWIVPPTSLSPILIVVVEGDTTLDRPSGSGFSNSSLMVFATGSSVRFELVRSVIGTVLDVRPAKSRTWSRAW